MNNNNSLYADVTILVSAIVILVSFLLLPFIPPLSALDLMSAVSLADALNMDPTNVGDIWMILLLTIMLTPLIAGLAAAIGLGMRQHSRTVSWVALACGSLGVLVLLIMLFEFANNAVVDPTGQGQGGFSLALSSMGFGFWLILALNIVLIVQVFVPRIEMSPAPAPEMFAEPIPPPLVGGGMMVEYEAATMQPPRPQPAAPPPQPAAPARSLTNAWLIDPSTQQSHQLFQGETRIGRSRQRNDVVLNHPRVSREHALIREIQGQFVVYEVGAQQPIYVNDRAIHGQHVLNPNDQLRLGDMVLRFVRG